MGKFYGTLPSLFMAFALTSTALSAQEQISCSQPSDHIAIQIDDDGVKYTIREEAPITYGIEMPEYPENVLSLSDLDDEGLVEQAMADLIARLKGDFDDVEINRDHLIKLDPNMRILATAQTTYVEYNGDLIDWGDAMNQVAFMKSYGTNVSDYVNIIVNTMRTVLSKLNNVESVCSLPITKLSLEDGMLRPQARPVSP